jgi:hypothetical protein
MEGEKKKNKRAGTETPLKEGGEPTDNGKAKTKKDD